ncbi:MAG: bifunctional proline dehydrogenase/L-glutamate gamma-semialdehyde dehydrogenase PutA [Metallibacterium scheffleri]|jgi:RHH-type proline utilization regulon transcriptional repressor/proline dehydrogenase/delta 1-pyrroline-5-carboxylate dehydrogenase|uniref:bifunctional proline dehydrogenase/L-glutamate gamma-semialdehyde dehydrogenase PutA n=1 Tax=Metallibacterium scheffleri TaxID=993689 RepID=UPI0026F194D1|nr:bifunctional proline dehydrogenase/L-glutamate gamma-semialdehyde dehydrogenase PutA [Metallibacterium scheffleri]MCK9366034.1 bifunctional proline dehydrogenase/L-glutamate gamma-semialdehyde dehydrogenase PutA [Metallibacterium scheffleri]
MTILESELPVNTRFAAISAAWSEPEERVLAARLAEATPTPAAAAAIAQQAIALVEHVRARTPEQSAVESFMRQYDLSSEEGVLLMCVAEALLRIPDSATADRLIQDKLGDADWEKHLGKSDSLFVNASTWGLLLTGRLVQLSGATERDWLGAIKRMTGRSGEPVVRLAVRQAMRIMGHQFVMGRSIEEAQDRAAEKAQRAYRYSYDMLGEAALTAPDAARYLQAYRDAIRALGRRGPYRDVLDAPSISVKLSALHPRYEVAQRARVLRELVPQLLELAQLAKAQGIGMTVDAEEAERLELSLEVIGAVFAERTLDGWEGYGLAIQAYQKRTPFVIDWLVEQSRAVGRRWCVRLVKGAYWDAEIKRAQELGHAGYPVFTRKVNTDVSYLACARRLLDAGSAHIFPAFATHNAHTVAAIHHFAAGRPFEFQRLHGMGADLYAEVVGKDKLDVPCRVYAPVGSHEDLLPYLVRRLLENGANTSFVNRISDAGLAPAELVADPCAAAARNAQAQHPRIPLPLTMYLPVRNNSMGVNFANDPELRALAAQINANPGPWQAAPLVPGAVVGSAAPRTVTDPADRRRTLGQWLAADSACIERALGNAVTAQPGWDATPAATRAAVLERAADLLEQRRGAFIALCVREAGKTLPASVAEVREAADFLRYYAHESRRLCAAPITLPGPTGEQNRMHLHGRGVFVCISPWNFPLAIFTGQIAAALATGNSVIAKPAEQATLIGHAMTRLLHEAGVPADVLQFVPGDGATVGAALTRDARVAGVAFTGGTDTAWAINRSLAARNAPIATLIAETGGQNALIADSSALPEQLVKDAIASAFDSAGQRCSAARVLFVQADIADKVLTMLAGAMAELRLGDPGLLSTDIGPVIDQDALDVLTAHAARMQREARLIAEVPLPAACAHGTFFAPRAYEIASIGVLQREVFGPVLHVVRWQADQLDAVIAAINATGYGLTLGIHSRIDTTIERISQGVRAGNCYVNRNQIGAVVGVQPFGGEGLSGTGPKAGGPHYLQRFMTERVISINTTAAGGNASLLTLGE